MNKYIYLAIFLLLTACGGGSDNKGKPQAENEKPDERETLVLDCSTITSNAEQATQGGVVTINSSKPIQHAYYLHQKADQSTQEIEIILRKNSDDYLVAIPYLRQFANGGTMNLAISASRESNRCNLPAITLSALPAADKSVTDDLLDQVESMVNNYKSMVGFSDSTTKEDYQSDPLLFSAALANAYFFDPESEISLPYVRNLISKLTDEEKTFVAQVIQDSDLIEQVKAASNNYKQSIASVAKTEKNVQSAIAHLPLTPIARNPGTEFSSRKIANSNCTNALNDPAKHRVQITDLKSLSAAMKLAKDANDKLAQSAANPSTTKDNITSTVGAAAAILGGPGGALVGAISALPGIVNFVNEHSLKQIAGLLPSSLGEINVSIIPKTRLEEDFTDKASNPFWNAKFSAKSKGLNLSKQIVDTAFTVAGAAPGIPAVSNINMTGVSKVSGKVFNSDAGTDCGLIIAPQSWTVAADNANNQYYTDEIEGDAFVLEQNRKLKPVKLGSSTLTVTLKSNLFPSEGSTLDTFEKSIDIENVRKQYSASSTVLIEKAGNNANVTIAAIDTANVDSYQLDLDEGLNTISEQVSGNLITLTLGTTTDEKKYPLSLTITSTSKDLEPRSPPRNKTIKIDVSPIKVTITKSNEVLCNNEDAYEVDLTAVVEGAKKDQGVDWSFEGTGAVLSPNGNKAFFTTSSTNNFTIKATSKEDPKAFDALIINPRDCKANIYINSQSGASIESPSVDSNCNVATNPTKFEADDVTFGSSLENIKFTPNGIKTLQLPLSEGLTRTWNSSIQEQTTSSYQKQNGDCESFTVTQSGKTKGSFSADNDNGVTLNQTLSSAGRCYIKDGDSEPICDKGKALTVHNIFWLFDHSGATSYELTNDMVCTTPPLLPALPAIPNVPNLPAGAKAPTNTLSDLNQNLRYSLLVFDQNGQQIAPNIEVNKFWNPIIGTQCYKGAAPLRSNTWNIPDFGQPATVIIMAIFNDTVINHNTSQPGTLSASGTSAGTIRVKTKSTP